ncbi:unnamed protein product [Notodromas monacha]|uniref:EF-hand domain-containing protein n=1 Tax=Notodromas monacha TaxID=399045 RepID=A0A7R9BRI9_9CRUS|nr:unnamed protein product [Notodromas monacha]CAG0920356.1 unnamed protein product [Notodromas monacha]
MNRKDARFQQNSRGMNEQAELGSYRYHPYPEFAEFSSEQVYLLKDIFDDADYNKDGRIDVTDLSYIFEKWGFPIELKHSAELIRRTEMNGGNTLIFSDFMTLWRNIHEGDVPASMRNQLLRTVEVLGIRPNGEQSTKLRFAGAKGFFEQNTRMPIHQQQSPEKEETLKARFCANTTRGRNSGEKDPRWNEYYG